MAGSDSACGTEGFRTGDAVRGWEEAGGIPREHPTWCVVWGCPKEKLRGAACLLSSDVLVRDLFGS